MRSTIPHNYIVYIQEFDYNVGAKNDHKTFSQVMSCKESTLWYSAMKEEMSLLPVTLPSKHMSFGGQKKVIDREKSCNWRKKSIFFELLYWSSLVLRHNLDVMNIEKNV